MNRLEDEPLWNILCDPPPTVHRHSGPPADRRSVTRRALSACDPVGRTASMRRVRPHTAPSARHPITIQTLVSFTSIDLHCMTRRAHELVPTGGPESASRRAERRRLRVVHGAGVLLSRHRAPGDVRVLMGLDRWITVMRLLFCGVGTAWLRRGAATRLSTGGCV